jgi:lipopolysaccharide/colanic/teichoic acid biosynthesis glycosyltransferase
MPEKPLIRIFDILFCLVLLFILSVPLFLLMIVKLYFDGRPLFYNSQRIGKNAVPFTVYKLRTMVNDRGLIENYLKNINSFGFEKIPVDAIVYTRLGRFFERYQIVELMQIFNVLKGNMSLIGYRPLPRLRVSQLEEELGREKVEYRHSVLPGITGLSQIVGKTNLTNAERVDTENFYNNLLQNKSQLKVLVYNILIISETFCQIIFKRSYFMGFFRDAPDLYVSKPLTQAETLFTEPSAQYELSD